MNPTLPVNEEARKPTSAAELTTYVETTREQRTATTNIRENYKMYGKLQTYRGKLLRIYGKPFPDRTTVTEKIRVDVVHKSRYL